MADGAPAEAASVAEQLLAFYREPVLHRPRYLHGQQPLPKGHVVLRMALGRFPDAGLRDIAREHRDELSVAARSFVRQVCFWDKASHYQVLCLPSHATRETVRENYHLVIALIHPDRQEASSEAWPMGCVQRVNQAHATLSDSRLRAEYDARLARAAEAPMHEPQSRSRVARDRRGHGRIDLAGLGKRAVVLAGVIAALFIVQAWWVGEGPSEEHALLARTFPASARWMRNVLPDPPRFLAPASPMPFEIARLEPLKEPRRLAAIGSWIPVREEAHGTVAPTPAPESPPAAVAAEVPAAPASPPAPVPRALEPSPPLRVAQSVSVPRMAQAATPPRADPSSPSRDQVESVVASLVGYYDAGDAERLVGLIDPDELGLWRGFRTRTLYADFFEATRERRLRVERLTWQNGADGIKARGEATVVADYRDGRSRLERRIPVELDIAMREGQPRITRLVLFPGGQ